MKLITPKKRQKTRRAFRNVFFLLAFGLLAAGAENTKPALADSPRQAGGPSTAQKKIVISEPSFLDAAFEGNLKTVQMALDQGVNVNVSHQEGRTALMFASFDGHTEIARLLIDNGARIDDQDAFGRTALMYAASGPNRETVQLLLTQKADPNIVDKQEGWTALMFAAAEGQTEVVRILLRYGADKTLKDVDGDAAINFARKNNHREVMKLLE